MSEDSVMQSDSLRSSQMDTLPTDQELKELAALSLRTDLHGYGTYHDRLRAFQARYGMTFREAIECVDAGRVLLAAEGQGQ